MNKRTRASIVIGLAGLAALFAAWYLSDSTGQKASVPETEAKLTTPEKQSVYIDEGDFDEDHDGDITRITIEDSGAKNESVKKLLSEKVIIDNVVVDKKILDEDQEATKKSP